MKFIFYGLAILLVFSGCGKQSEAKQSVPARKQIDPKEIFIRASREPIQLLAVKHGLSPRFAEEATWEYYQRHHIGYKFLMAKTQAEKQAFRNNALQEYDNSTKGVAETIRFLSTRYGFKESSFAAFLYDLERIQAE